MVDTKNGYSAKYGVKIANFKGAGVVKMEKPNFLTVDACPQLSYDFGIMALQFFSVSFVAIFLAAWLFIIYVFKNFDDSLKRDRKNGANHD